MFWGCYRWDAELPSAKKASPCVRDLCVQQALVVVVPRAEMCEPRRANTVSAQQSPLRGSRVPSLWRRGPTAAEERRPLRAERNICRPLVNDVQRVRPEGDTVFA